jgi:hypothetical protein
VINVLYIADAPRYGDYLPIVQHIIGSLQVVVPTPEKATKFLQYENSSYGIKILYLQIGVLKVLAIHLSSHRSIHKGIIEAM